MNLICPFLSSLPAGTGHGEYYLCPGDCALWVIDEEMCSFRLLAGDVADHRKRIRDAGQQVGTKEEPSQKVYGPPLDCRHCERKQTVAIVEDKLHCFACGKTWPKEKP